MLPGFFGQPLNLYRKNFAGLKIGFAPAGPYDPYSTYDAETEATNIGVQAGVWLPSGVESFRGVDGIPYLGAPAVGRQMLVYSEYDRATHNWVPVGSGIDSTYYFNNAPPVAVGVIPDQLAYTNILFEGPILDDFATDSEGDALTWTINSGVLPTGVTIQVITIDPGQPSERIVNRIRGTPVTGQQGVDVIGPRATDIVGDFVNLPTFTLTTGIGQLVPITAGVALAPAIASIGAALTTSAIIVSPQLSGTPGFVISTSPLESTYVSPASPITVFVGGYAAPNTVGLTQAAAVATWGGISITPTIVLIASDSVAAGIVISQTDANDSQIVPGIAILPGADVTLTISTGGGVIPTGSSSAQGSAFITANDIIMGALRFINEYAPGESIDADDANDALDTLNDLLASFSTDQASVFATADTILNFIPGQYIYTIGNYAAGTFAGTVTTGSPTITFTNPPTDMVIRGDLSGVGIPAGTTIIAFDVVAGTITMSQNATTSPGAQQIGYTVCGDFKVERPLRVGTSFTRYATQSSGLDYPIEVVSQDRYIEIGYKGIGAPWPICMWYNPTMPLGTLYFYQSPSGAGELHLFADAILTNITSLTQQIVMPQGYVRMLKRMLARELAPEYGKTWTAQQEKLAMEAYNAIKSLNQIPIPVAKYDNALINRGSGNAWILTGGF